MQCKVYKRSFRHRDRMVQNETKEPWPNTSVGASSRYTKVEGLTSGQGAYKNQPMNVSISGTTN